MICSPIIAFIAPDDSLEFSFGLARAKARQDRNLLNLQIQVKTWGLRLLDYLNFAPFYIINLNF